MINILVKVICNFNEKVVTEWCQSLALIKTKIFNLLIDCECLYILFYKKRLIYAKNVFEFNLFYHKLLIKF